MDVEWVWKLQKRMMSLCNRGEIQSKATKRVKKERLKYIGSNKIKPIMLRIVLAKFCYMLFRQLF